ncbi:MAG: hypothetical protein IH914_10930, partial [candidate division Zixibacteria bacterium]|nr:hypothetical protein [candidate division Zixibacteria bacterium]
MNFQIAAIAFVALLLWTSGSKAQRHDLSGSNLDSETVRESMPARQAAFVESINRFGFKLFREIAATTPVDSNVFVSPLSAALVLSIAYNGAAGSTRKEIAACLELDDVMLEGLNQSWRELIGYITSKDSLVEVGLANSLWTRVGKKMAIIYFANLSDFGVTFCVTWVVSWWILWYWRGLVKETPL